ncbi:MAG: hypothetical protein ACI31G_02415 [Bacilli bacterium]
MNNDVQIKKYSEFTEERYATKAEVRNELKIGLIDSIWNTIMEYREKFYRVLPLKQIDNSSLKLCYCQNISNKIQSLDSKLIRSYSKVVELKQSKDNYRIFKNNIYSETLNFYCTYKNIPVSKEFLRSVVMKDIKRLNNEYSDVVRYLSCLEYIESKFVNPINEDFLADLYSLMTGNAELVSFYREKDDTNPSNNVLIDRIYSCAPTKLISPMMNLLFDYLNSSADDGILKAIIAFYYFMYIKPFPNYNLELTTLVMKICLGRNRVWEVCSILPLEKIMLENMDKINQEVQKSGDISYFVDKVYSLIDSSIDDFLDSIANINVEMLRSDFYQEDEGVSLIEEVEDTSLEVKANNEPIEENKIAYVYKKESLAVSYIPPALDEKEASRLEEHLLELDPTMRRNEAAFYARHCTMGKKYTISQCKKYLNSAYETARKTMERLVELGYYRREMVKNKSVYTPILRK